MSLMETISNDLKIAELKKHKLKLKEEIERLSVDA